MSAQTQSRIFLWGKDSINIYALAESINTNSQSKKINVRLLHILISL